VQKPRVQSGARELQGDAEGPTTTSGTYEAASPRCKTSAGATLAHRRRRAPRRPTVPGHTKKKRPPERPLFVSSLHQIERSVVVGPPGSRPLVGGKSVGSRVGFGLSPCKCMQVRFDCSALGAGPAPRKVMNDEDERTAESEPAISYG